VKPGAQTTGTPASCADTNECADAGGACGPYTNCTNISGSYLCNCVAGASGSPTDGGPASCGPVLNTIGVATGASNSLSYTLTQPLDAGVHLVLVAAAENGFNVSDTKSNVWIRAAQSSGCAGCAFTGIHHSTLVTPLVAGDRITLQSFGSFAAMWIFSSEKYPHLDTVGTSTSSNNNVTSFLVTGSAPVSNADELVVAGFASKDTTTMTPDGGATTAQGVSSAVGSSLLEYKAGQGLSGPQSLSGQASVASKFSGVLATFYGGPRVAPTGFSLTHSPRHRDFVVNWTGGRGNGGPNGCSVRYLDKTGVSKSAGNNLNCDADTSQTVTLPISAGWYGGAWSSVTVQLVRNSDGALMATFAQRLTCTSTGASSVPTGNIDEDCDNDWDDHTCATWTWVRGTIYGNTVNACTNSSDTATTYACNGTSEAVVRYTQGQQTTLTPTVTWSSGSHGTGCAGPYTGAVEWTCVGSGCSYR
jgi:hypothetical protein